MLVFETLNRSSLTIRYYIIFMVCKQVTKKPSGHWQVRFICSVRIILVATSLYLPLPPHLLFLYFVFFGQHDY